MFFTPVCHSVHRGCLADTPWADTPRSRHPLPEQTTYPEQPHTPEQTPTPQRNPPIADPLPAAATEEDSTHHTGMHSSSFNNFDAILVNMYFAIKFSDMK